MKPINDILEDFDVNVFKLMNEALDSGIELKEDVVGSSEIAYCMKKLLLQRELGSNFDGNNKTLFGQIFEEVLYKPEVLTKLICYINDKIELEDIQVIQPQREGEIEVKGGKIRLHPDIWTDKYIVEVKTTGIYTKYWDRTLAPYQLNQLNTYLGHWGIELGFMLKINLRAFLSQIDDTQKFYWDKLWENYGYLIPVEFDPEMYQLTIERAEELFRRFEAKDFQCDGPEFGWECKHCQEHIREACGKSMYKCKYCGRKKMWEYPSGLTEGFTANPICEACFHKVFPRYKYSKFKYRRGE